jgi:hypothetical protein
MKSPFRPLGDTNYYGIPDCQERSLKQAGFAQSRRNLFK